MRTARILSLTFAIALPVFIGGCQSTPDPSIELLESELRWYEDQLYLMNRELTSYQQQLESARRFNRSLQSEVSQAGDSTAGTSGEKPSSSRGDRKSIFPFGILQGNQGSGGSSGSDGSSSSSSAEEDDFPIPDISRGSEEASPDAIPEATLGPDDPTNGDPGFDRESGDANEVFDEELESFELEEIGVSQVMRDDAVSQVVFNKQLTGGHNSDGRAGDDGLYIVLEPRTGAGVYSAVPGELTIEVYADGQPRSLQSRVARWDFDAAETAHAMRESLLGKGVHLQLSWPADPPATKDLVVVAKFVRGDGKRLVAERAIKIDPDGTRSLPRHAR